MELDYKKICRVCLSTGNMMSVFKVNISKKLMSCASIQVWPNDGLPNQICQKCSAKLHIAFQFRKLCQKSDSKLRECLNKPTTINTEMDTNSHKDEQIKQEQEHHQQQQQQSVNNLFTVPILQTTISDIPTDIEYISVTEPQISFNGQNTLDYNNMTVQYAMTEVNQLNQEIIGGITTNIPISHTTNTSEEILPITNENVKEVVNINSSLLIKSQDTDNNTKDTTCKVCGKVMSTSFKLKRHMCTHVIGPPIKCNICMKGFKHRGNYKVHMMMHTNERPFKCTICGYGCRQQQDMDKHMRTHTGERPDACHLCPKTFANRSNLIVHIRTHTGERPYVCCVCEKGFCQSNELTKHMRTHTGEKPNVCHVCNKGFNGASALKVHQRLHTGEKPYSCYQCNKEFVQLHSLKAHCLKMHYTDSGGIEPKS